MADRTSSAIADTPDREFEIILDNKRLFSLLFIVFVLLGVFFAMGYLMGRNTVPVDTAAATGTRTPATAAETTRRPSATEDLPATSGKPPVTQPAAEPAPETTPAAQPSTPPPDPGPPALTVVEPKAGQTFLQVAAITKAEAGLLVEVLVKKGFKAILAPAPGPRENIFRVLVGPVTEGDDTVALRTQLEQSGFKPIPSRY